MDTLLKLCIFQKQWGECISRNRRSEVKTLAATATTFFIGVIENKLTAQVGSFKAHLCANQGHYSFVIDNNLDSLFFYYLIKFFYLLLLDVVHIVGETWTSFFWKTYFDSNLW